MLAQYAQSKDLIWENLCEIGRPALNFVQRGVCCCSAVTGDSLALPSPSLGVSSLDLGRSRKVSGPFSFQRNVGLFSRRAIGPQFLGRDGGETISQNLELAGKPGEAR